MKPEGFRIYGVDKTFKGKSSGSVVACWTQDRVAAGSSLTGVTAVWSEQDTFILA